MSRKTSTKKKKEKKSLGKRIRDLKQSLVKLIAAEIPSALTPKYLGQVAVGIIMIIIGLSIMIFAKSFAFGAFPACVGVILVIMGFLYKQSVLKGYFIVEGKIIERTQLFPTMRSNEKVADGFTLLLEDSKKIHVPTDKRKNDLPIGTMLRVYILKDASRYEHKGVISIGNILGYEVISID